MPCLSVTDVCYHVSCNLMTVFGKGRIAIWRCIECNDRNCAENCEQAISLAASGDKSLLIV